MIGVGVLGVLVIFGLIGLVVLVGSFIFRRDRRDAEVDDWARGHGLELTPQSRPWVDDYLRTGRNLRQIGGFGGLVVAASVTAATGLDLYVSGLVWVLLGYLVGCFWAELALTRAPNGARRSASLVTRRLGDYLPRRMQIAEVVVPITALLLGAIVGPTHLEPTLRALAPGELPPTGFHLVSPYATDAAVRQGALTATLMAPLVMGVVWLAQRYLIGRPQPVVDPSLVAADDALRSSSIHLLGGSGLAAGCLLIGSQLGYLITVTQGLVQAALIVALVASFAAAWVLFRWRNAPWQVRRPTFGDPGPASDQSDSARGPSGGRSGGPSGGSGSSFAADPADPPMVVAGLGSGAAAATEVRTSPAPAGPTGRLVADDPTWSMRRSPVPIAVGLVVIVALAGWGLRTWGPINPAVEISQNGLGTDRLGGTAASLMVHNEASAPVQITDLRTVPSPTDPLASTPPEIVAVSVTRPVDGGSATTGTLPIEVPGRTLLQLVLTLNPDAVSCSAGTISTPPFDIDLTYRTTSGRSVRKQIAVSSTLPATCLPPLPTGPPPTDPVAAEAAVRAAANLAYDPNAGASRLDAIDDPRGVAEANAEVLAGPYADAAATTTATIREISFDRPDHAWFRYGLSVGFGDRTGEAVLIDGRWKVTRATVCADIALANVTCPPLPG